MSSSLRDAPATPLPPLPCLLNSSVDTVLTYPPEERVTTRSSSSIRSSITNSPGSTTNSVLRSLANSSRMLDNSSITKSRTSRSSDNIVSNSVISSARAATFSSTCSLPRRVNLPSCISKM